MTEAERDALKRMKADSNVDGESGRWGVVSRDDLRTVIRLAEAAAWRPIDTAPSGLTDTPSAGAGETRTFWVLERDGRYVAVDATEDGHVCRWTDDIKDARHYPDYLTTDARRRTMGHPFWMSEPREHAWISPDEYADGLAAEIGRLKAELAALIHDLDRARETANEYLAERDALAGAARGLRFNAYPAHGSGFVCTVQGDLGAFQAALAALPKEPSQ